jgi:TusA-related sulfurtransferase
MAEATELKLKAADLMDAGDVLAVITGLPGLPYSLSLKLLRMFRTVRPEKVDLAELQANLQGEYVKRDKDGSWIPGPEGGFLLKKQKEYQRKVEDLLGQECPVTVVPLDLSEFGDIWEDVEGLNARLLEPLLRTGMVVDNEDQKAEEKAKRKRSKS